MVTGTGELIWSIKRPPRPKPKPSLSTGKKHKVGDYKGAKENKVSKYQWISSLENPNKTSQSQHKSLLSFTEISSTAIAYPCSTCDLHWDQEIPYQLYWDYYTFYLWRKNNTALLNSNLWHFLHITWRLLLLMFCQLLSISWFLSGSENYFSIFFPSGISGHN